MYETALLPQYMRLLTAALQIKSNKYQKSLSRTIDT